MNFGIIWIINYHIKYYKSKKVCWVGMISQWEQTQYLCGLQANLLSDWQRNGNIFWNYPHNNLFQIHKTLLIFKKNWKSVRFFIFLLITFVIQFCCKNIIDCLRWNFYPTLGGVEFRVVVSPLVVLLFGNFALFQFCRLFLPCLEHLK